MLVLRGVGKRNLYLEPITIIEWIVSICTLIGGLYLFTPLYETVNATTTSAVHIFSHPAMIFFWGAVLIIGALLVVFGLATKQPQMRSAGWFTVIMARTFQLISVFMVSGFFPLTWIYPFTITLVAVVLWTLARIEVDKHAS